MSLTTFTPQAASRSIDDSRTSPGTPSPSSLAWGGLLALSPTSPNHLYHNDHYRSSPTTTTTTTTTQQQQQQYLLVLPVLLLEFLAIALTRAVLPQLLIAKYGRHVYVVLGAADCVRGLLAFGACPLFGKLSDSIGRKPCLFWTVLGTCAPVCSLALVSWHSQYYYYEYDDEHRFLEEHGGATLAEEPWSSSTTTSTGMIDPTSSLPPMAIPIFVVLLSLSGIFSSTFTLVFAYISDSVTQRTERVTAYGLALATFGLSFTIGPMAGGYLAQYHTQSVFVCSLILTIVDLLYIVWILPESLPKEQQRQQQQSKTSLVQKLFEGPTTTTTTTSPKNTNKPHWQWPWQSSMTLLLQDPFLRTVGKVAFLYYTGLWAVLSTLSVYAVQRFHLTPQRLGELMSALGLSTMMAEAVLVRILVPWLGETRSTKLGLLSFAMQCLLLGAAYRDWHLLVCVVWSILGNLVYPSLSSLVSVTVEPRSVGEALGAMNGVKALTEGIGPLVFGALMTISEDSILPGCPYWIAALLVYAAYVQAQELPDDHPPHPSHRRGSGTSGDEYIHELEFKRRHSSPSSSTPSTPTTTTTTSPSSWLASLLQTPTRDEDEEEYQGLLDSNKQAEEQYNLSDVEESSLSPEEEPFVVVASVSMEEEDTTPTSTTTATTTIWSSPLALGSLTAITTTSSSIPPSF